MLRNGYVLRLHICMGKHVYIYRDGLTDADIVMDIGIDIDVDMRI